MKDEERYVPLSSIDSEGKVLEELRSKLHKGKTLEDFRDKECSRFVPPSTIDSEGKEVERFSSKPHKDKKQKRIRDLLHMGCEDRMDIQSELSNLVSDQTSSVSTLPMRESSRIGNHPITSNLTMPSETKGYQPKDMREFGLTDYKHHLLKECTLIKHNEGLYYYTGKCYQLIPNEDSLLILFRTKVSHELPKLKSTRIFTEFYKYLNADPDLVPKDYECRLAKSSTLVSCSNKIFDIENRSTLQHDQQYLTFHELNARIISHKKAYAPYFDDFLDSSCNGDYQIKKRVCEVMGYLFSNNNDAKRFFVIGTAPDSGKSTLSALLKSIIGKDYISSIPPQKLGDRFALGSISGVCVNLAMDVPKGKLNANAVSILKSITGNDSITIEQKYQPQKTIVSNTRFLFGTNHPITVPKEEDDEAFWNRMCIIPFENSVPDEKRDPELLDKLLKERDAIVTLCLYHYATVLRNNNRFSECIAADRMKARWKQGESNYAYVNRFWREEICETGDMQSFLPNEGIYKHYCDFCTTIKISPIHYKIFISWIKDNADPQLCQSTRKRIYGSNSNPVHGFQGIRFRYENREEDNS